MSFGDTLRSFRTSRGYTQMKLAEALGFSQTSIASWENGTREPDFGTIRKIADYFNVPASAFFAQDVATTDEYSRIISERFAINPKLRELVEKLQYLSDTELDALIVIVSSIAKQAYEN